MAAPTMTTEDNAQTARERATAGAADQPDAPDPVHALADQPDAPDPVHALADQPDAPDPVHALADQPDTPDPEQALAEALATVGDRWTLLVVAALLDGPRRFGELQSEVRGIAPNVLTQRLRSLERNAIVIARPYSERPPRFVYELTTSGQELAGALRMIAGWGARHAGQGTAPRHALCGTPMEARWWCPTCERPVTDEEGEDLHFA